MTPTPQFDVKGQGHAPSNSTSSINTFVTFNDNIIINDNIINNDSAFSSMMEYSPRNHPLSSPSSHQLMMNHVSIPNFSTNLEETTYLSIIEMGFKAEHAHFAVDAYQGHPEKSLDFVTKFYQLSDMGGFRDLDIKEALLMVDRDLMRALDYLVAIDTDQPQQ